MSLFEKCKGLLEAEAELNDNEIFLVKDLLREDRDLSELAPHYERHGVLDSVTTGLLSRSISEKQLSEMLVTRKIGTKKIPEFVYLVFKNYKKSMKELYKFLKPGPAPLWEMLINSMYFKNEYYIYLCRLMKNITKFVDLGIEKGIFEMKSASVFATSSTADALALLYDKLYLLGEGKEEIMEQLLKNPYLPDKIAEEIKEHHESKYTMPEMDEKQRELEENLYRKIKNMSAGQKIKMAMTGGKSARSLLIRDSNKQVSTAVVNNPQVQIDEIEFHAKNKNTGEHIIREIYKQNAFIKEYVVVRALAFNPKTPLDIGVKLLQYLMFTDVEELSKSRDISANLRNMAKRLVEMKKRK